MTEKNHENIFQFSTLQVLDRELKEALGKLGLKINAYKI